MKKSVRMFAVASALASAATLSGCYVVPIDPRYPPESLPVGASPVSPQALAMTTQARLYPLNETAGKMGPLSATVVDTANGRATFSLRYAGEILQGEASRVPAGYPGFGRVHQEVYGAGNMPAGQRGIASAANSQGTYVNCEYALNAPNRGTGACLFSNGAKYQLHFGS